MRRFIPDFTRDPEGQPLPAQIVGVALLLALFVLAAVR